jgi:predicted nucleic acid-binding protein
VLRQHRRVVAWWGTPVEAQSSLARLLREGAISEAQRHQAVKQLARLRRAWVEILPTEQVRSSAIELIDRFPLRTGDSFQLAAAIVWCDEKPHHRPFVSFDGRLASAAAELGFDVISLA